MTEKNSWKIFARPPAGIKHHKITVHVEGKFYPVKQRMDVCTLSRTNTGKYYMRLGMGEVLVCMEPLTHENLPLHLPVLSHPCDPGSPPLHP